MIRTRYVVLSAASPVGITSLDIFATKSCDIANQCILILFCLRHGA